MTENGAKPFCGRHAKALWNVLILLFVVLPCGLAQAQWKPAKGPLLTRWGATISSEQIHPEYPRPQMVRADWLNLNGLWDYAITNDEIPHSYQGQILVPFPVESALSGVMKRLDERSTLWYRRTFAVPKSWAGKRVRLHFGASDWKTTVHVNGKQLGVHRGGYDGFSLDITKGLKQDGPQELVVEVFDPTESDQPRGKQSRKPDGIFYTPNSGIWQTVWLEPVPETSIDALKLIPDVDARVLRLQVTTTRTAENCQVQAVAMADGKEAGRIIGSPNTELLLPIPEPKLWSPDEPFLYDLTIQIKQGSRVIDSVSSYFGMRKISVRKDVKGITRILLNDQFIFLLGTLDQGYWPDGIYTAPCDDALRYDIDVVKKLGFNMVRKHVKVEPERWYYWCDKLGLLVWQDMPSANNATDESRRQFETELLRMIEGRGNHPSIMMWVLFNEGWGQYETERLAHWVQEVDPTRLINSASGWTDKRVGDVVDMHSYPGPGAPLLEANRAAVLGEFGGLGLGITNHTWSKQVWGYQGMSDSRNLTRQYVLLLTKAWSLKDTAGLSAAVYTQTTDIETECNGLMTYDREIIKVDQARAAAVTRGEVSLFDYKVVVPDAEHEPILWRFSVKQPPADWFKPDFDDSTWPESPAGFGTVSTPNAIVRTEWKSDDIWLRRQFHLDQTEVNTLQLHLYHDEDAEVYLNGVLAASEPGFIAGYVDCVIAPEALATLKPGYNTIALHCHQSTGGQYIDAGLVSVAPSEKQH